MSSQFSLNRKVSATFIQPRCQNIPGKTGGALHAGYTHGNVAQRWIKDQVAWLQLRPCLVPSWRGASKTF